jgi:hypothetical protein
MAIIGFIHTMHAALGRDAVERSSNHQPGVKG